MEIINELINNCINYLQATGLIGGFFLILLESMFPVLPLALFIGMNLLAFGNVTGFMLSYFATIVGCMISFSLFKYVLKNLFYKIFKKDKVKKIEKLMTRINNIDFNALVIIHALPFTPSFLTNIAAGLSNMKTKKYFVSLLIGKLAIVYFWGYIGSGLLKDIKNPMVIIKMIIIVFVAYIISKIIEKIFKVEE